MLRGGENLVVGVVVGKVYVRTHDNGCIKVAIVDAESDERNFQARGCASCNGSVLLLKVVGKLWTVVSTVALSEETKVAILILWELSVEELQKLVYVGGSCHRAGHRVCTIAEASTDGLIDVEHVGIRVPRFIETRQSS